MASEIFKNVTNNPIIRRYPVGKREALALTENDWLAQEIPVALVYNGISHAVMMACPQDLEDFVTGFSLSEGIIDSASEIYAIEQIRHPQGIEMQIELSSRRFVQLKARRRMISGRSGCGICGVEQLDSLEKPIAPLPVSQRFALSGLDSALARLDAHQPVCQLTGCTHVAAWITADGQLSGSHEDIGRHVALDKLLGRRARENWQQGAVLISSRASYEMVQKSAMCGVEILFAVSAATTLAVDLAQRCQLTLVGFCRTGRATVYSHPQRLM